MSILITKPGILTTVQDLGRVGYRHLGISPGGPMDSAAARLANIVVGNRDDAALLEMHFPAGEVVFETNSVACVCGADFSPHLDGVRLANWQPFFAEKGGTLKFPKRVSGNRAYLAIAGGFDIEEWLGSASTNLTAGVGGFEGRKLIAKDRLGTRKKMSIHRKRVGGLISQALRPHYRPFPTVRVVKGAEYECLTGQSRRSLTHHDFTISKDSNRMGFRLVGPPLTFNKHKELLSSAVDFGTIQALPDGQLIVLMADAQTAGGYPRIAHVISRDLPLIAQLGANDKVAFHLVELAEAEELAAEFERELNLLRVGCRFQAKSWD